MKKCGPPQAEIPTGPNCATCPYSATSIGYVPASGSLHSLFLFLLENPTLHEIENGHCGSGAAGKLLRTLLRENTSVRLSEQLLTPVCRCWPIQIDEDGDFATTTYGMEAKRLPDILRDREMIPRKGWVRFTTFVTEKPSPGQIRECAARYTNELIENFTGKYIISLGKIPTSYMLSSNISIKNKRGTIHVSGEVVECPECMGKGETPRTPIKCKSCKDGKLRCDECNRWKHLKTCSIKTLRSCKICGGTGQQPRPPRSCRECEGSGKVPKDPKNPYICERLRQNQILFPTLNPAVLNHDPKMWTIVARDFSRIESLEEEVSAEDEFGDYVEDPEESVKKEVVYVL